MGNRCFKTTTRGLGPNCEPRGNFGDTYNNVDSVSFQSGTIPQGNNYGGCSYDFLVIDGVSRYPDLGGGSASGTGTITEIDCKTGQPDTNFDCINGKCTPAKQYNTPGIFKKLSDCKSACGGGARCDGVCLDKDELNKIKALAGDIKGKVCG